MSAALAALLVWAPPLAAQEAGPDPAVLDQIQAQVVALRGLNQTQPVGIQVLASQELFEHLLDWNTTYRENVPPDLVQAARDFQQLMGFTAGPPASAAPVMAPSGSPGCTTLTRRPCTS